MPPDLDSEKKLFTKTLMDELCIKLKEIENMDLSHFEISSNYKTDILAMDSTHGFSYGPNKDTNCIEPVQPCLPPNVAWTWGLLHDSTSEVHKNKMENSFSKVLYNNCPEAFGHEFTWNKSDERNDGHNTDRIKFYNKQNLLVSECNEKLQEGNADVDKLIAKFDTNIEDIWKTTSESDYLRNVKYQTLFPQNFFTNPFIQFGSDLIWAFEENKTDGGVPEDPKSETKEGISSRWDHFSPPASTGSRNGLDAMFGAFGLALPNVKKWSAADSCADGCANAYGSSFPGNDKAAVEVSQNVQEDEDLLTSAKTHFRPIRADEGVGSQTGTYADGTTFAISNDLEKVSFKRSESGALYLEADADTPRKYMEFKEKDAGFNGKGDWENDVSSAEEFVPKFRVRQNNEKCCQTDEIDEEQVVPSASKSDGESVSYESEEDEFYFPGDDELAQNIVNAIEEETHADKVEENADCRRANVDGPMEYSEMSLYRLPEDKECICSRGSDWGWNGAEERTGKQEWSDIWNSQAACAGCRTNSDKLSSKDKFRFRQELTQEGEQLLMDLSCLQQMYSNSDWCDDDSTSASDLNEEESQVEGLSAEILVSSEADHFVKGGWWTYLIAKDEPAKNNFDLRSLWKEEKFLSNLIKSKSSETNERTLVSDVNRTERKRRNSSSQKACNLYLEGQCRRPHCRFAHCDSAIPCPFFADASCMKGESCPLSHSTRRPLSL